MSQKNFQEQFTRPQTDWMKNTDFPTWYRYFVLFKEISGTRAGGVLEIGGGSGVLEMVLKKDYPNYKTMDINPGLNPDYVSDIAHHDSKIDASFDMIICCDVLEHLPFEQFLPSLKNIYAYLRQGGKTYITIPHVRKEIMVISRYPFYKTYFRPLPYWLSFRGFYRWFIKKTITIDPFHYWEIGNRKVTEKDIENAIKTSGFRMEHVKKIPYVDLYVLAK